VNDQGTGGRARRLNGRPGCVPSSPARQGTILASYGSQPERWTCWAAHRKIVNLEPNHQLGTPEVLTPPPSSLSQVPVPFQQLAVADKPLCRSESLVSTNESHVLE